MKVNNYREKLKKRGIGLKNIVLRRFLYSLKIMFLFLGVNGGSYYMQFNDREKEFGYAEELKTSSNGSLSEEQEANGHSIEQSSDNQSLETTIGGSAYITVRANREFSINQTISVPEGQTVVEAGLILPVGLGSESATIEVIDVQINEQSVLYTYKEESGDYIDIIVEGEWSNTVEVITYKVKVVNLTSTGVLGMAVGQMTTLDGSQYSSESRFIQIPSFPVDSITLDPSSITLEMDETHQLLASITPENATDKTVFWSSSDAAIVAVDKTGIVTAICPGTAIVTAVTNDDGLIATSEVTVVGPHVTVTEVRVTPETGKVAVGEFLILDETVLPTNASNKTVFWSSSDQSVAIVDVEGRVVGLNPGNVIITVTTEDGEKQAESELTIYQPVTGVQLEPEKENIVIGEELLLQEEVLPANSTTRTVTWKSSDPLIGSVSDTGVVTGIQSGEVTITVITEDGGYTASATINVVEEGSLAFSQSLDALNFQDIVLSDRDIIAQREHKGPILTVLDTRWTKEPYSVQVSLEEPLSSQSEIVLLDALFFINTLGESKTLSSQRIEVFNHQPTLSHSSEAEESEIEWGADEGVLLRMTAKEMVPTQYSAVLNWHLVSGP